MNTSEDSWFTGHEFAMSSDSSVGSCSLPRWFCGPAQPAQLQPQRNPPPVLTLEAFANSGMRNKVSVQRHRKPSLSPSISNASLQLSPEELLAKELNQLSAREREEAYDDLHGVSDILEETPALVEQKLDELDVALTTSSQANSTSSVYQQAMQQSPDYIQGRPFRLMFLRATQFHVPDTVTRIHYFLEEKLQLFGPSYLTKERITYEDLSPDDRAVLEKGPIQILPLKDRAGRPVVFVNPALLQYQSVDNYMRVNFFMFMEMIQDDVEAQRRGWVAIVYHLDTTENNGEVIRRGSALRSHLPIRSAAAHICYQPHHSNGLQSLLTLGLKAVSHMARMRVRFHAGSSIECHYAMMGFGIPSHVFPVNKINKKFGHHALWIEQRKRQQSSLLMQELVQQVTSSTLISSDLAPPSYARPLTLEALTLMDESNSMRSTTPPSVLSTFSKIAPTVSQSCTTNIDATTPQDVLLGRGVPVMNHPGNLSYRQLVASYAESYNQGSKFEKTVLAEMILTQIHDSGGRFLKLLSQVHSTNKQSSLLSSASSSWEEIDDAAARIKVASAFRFVRKKKLQQQRYEQQQQPQHRGLHAFPFSDLSSQNTSSLAVW